MAEETLLKFSTELKTQRESKGISLAQISNRTRIDIKFLSAIEEGRFDLLPEIYMRAFIKEYSQLIDLNPSTILAKYDLAKSGKETSAQIETKSEIKNASVLKTEISEPPPVSVSQEVIIENNSAEGNNLPGNVDLGETTINTSKPVTNPKFNYILGGTVLIVAVIIFYFAFIQEPSKEIVYNENNEFTEEVNSQPRYELNQTTSELDSIKSSNITTANPTQTDQPVSQVKSDSLHLRVQVNSRVWIKVYSDGKVVFQQMVESGTDINYRAKSKFAVSIGDAGAVRLFYNNKLVPNIGKAGESRNISMTPEGFKYYTISNEKKSNPTN